MRDFNQVNSRSQPLGNFLSFLEASIAFEGMGRPRAVFPLETRSFEKKQIFQEEQKTIFAIIKPVLGIFF